jgi:hypothetical protein
MKTYKAIVWESDPQKPGQRVTVMAESLDDAKKQLEVTYGEGCVISLYNEDDAARPR